MKRKIVIELIEECDKVNYYAIRFKDETINQFDKFYDKFENDPFYTKDFDVIVTWLNKIGEDGADAAFFRSEGGSLKGLPVDTSKLRLYCFRVNECIVVLGNGGHKKSRTYQEDPELHKHVQDLNEAGRQLWNRFNNTTSASIYNCTLIGNLEFEIETDNLNDEKK
ncbi:MAG: hypothetical protein Q8L81_10905 [Bacteroidota bacterium]|nr:hypothetical protein [Bacteroidota bacterium]